MDSDTVIQEFLEVDAHAHTVHPGAPFPLPSVLGTAETDLQQAKMVKPRKNAM